MYLSVVIVAGHLYLSLIHPTTRHALRGITLGTVREDWARTHHTKWAGRPKQDAALQPISPPQLPRRARRRSNRKQAS